MSGLLGCRVRLATAEGDYRGTVHAVGERDGSVTLVGVTFACGEREEPLRGVQKFLRGDVRAVEVLESGPDVPAAAAASAPGTASDGALLDRRGRTQTFVSQRLVDDSLLLANAAAAEDSDDSAGGGEPAPRAASPPPRLARPDGFALVETLSELADAAAYLADQSYVGLAAEGALLGRAGQLSLLSLASAQFVFLVDVLACGGDAAVSELQPVLESREVTKVVHDCRRLSDLLGHQFGVRLQGVFDTQAAEVFLYHQRHGLTPEYVSVLPQTLVTRLQLLPRQVFFPHHRRDKLREDQEVWLRRPLPDPLLEAAVKNVVYLRELRHVQTQAMFCTLDSCVDAYLGAVRDADDEDAAAAPFETHRVPVRVQNILEASVVRPRRASPDHENPAVVNNLICNFDTNMQFTRNIWRTEKF